MQISVGITQVLAREVWRLAFRKSLGSWMVGCSSSGPKRLCRAGRVEDSAGVENDILAIGRDSVRKIGGRHRDQRPESSRKNISQRGRSCARNDGTQLTY